MAAQLTAELAQYRQDAIADGWNVSMHTNAPLMNDNQNVWANDDQVNGPHAVTTTTTQYRADLQTVKNMIAGDFPSGVPSGKRGAVVFIGHVTVPYSGLTDYDGHVAFEVSGPGRAMPTDQYYADLDGTPTTWGDQVANFSSFGSVLGSTQYEFTPNTPGDGRFDAGAVPGNAQVVTVSGSFTLTFGGATASFASNATAEDVRVGLNNLSSIGGTTNFVTVAAGTGPDANKFYVRFLGGLSANTTMMTAGGSATVGSSSTGGLELSFGRIDMANMRAAFGASETQLLQNYFQRDHNYRTGVFRPANKALVENDGNGQGNPNFASVLGSGNVDSDRSWLSHFTDTSPIHYLFASRTGNGALSRFDNPVGSRMSSYNVGDGDGIYGPPDGAPMTRVCAVFTMEGGSFMGDWNNRSILTLDGINYFDVPLPRALIAADYPALVGSENGEALVSMSLDELRGSDAGGSGLIRTDVIAGESVGEGFRQAINAHLSTPTVYEEFHGDPTLRIAYVKPVTGVGVSINLATGAATVSWTAPSSETVARYEVYKSDSLNGTFSLVNSTTGTNLTDSSGDGQTVYMVRAIRVDNSGLSTQYDNASTGVFASAVTLVGSSGLDNIIVRRETSSTTGIDRINVWDNDDEPNDPIARLDIRTTTSIAVQGGNGTNYLHVFLSGGHPFASTTVSFTGGTGTDTVWVTGTSGVDTATFASNSVQVNSRTITTDSTLDNVYWDGNGGADNVTISSAPAVTFKHVSPQFGALSLSGSGTLAKLTVTSGNQALAASSLSITSGAKLDLRDNNLIVHSGSYGMISGLIASARNGGAWDSGGITSSTAGANSSHNTTLGTLTYAEFQSVNGSSTFEGATITTGDVLVKYTYYGDTDFNGLINFDDYSRTDAGFNNNRSGWVNGDFDYTTHVNFDDYSLIDLAFNTQGSVVYTGGPGGGNPALIEIAQMPHFTQEYMYYFIDWNAENFGIHYTPEDFFPDGVPW